LKVARLHPKSGAVTLNRSEIASLGGLTASHKLGAEGRRRRASKGGEAVLEARGSAHFKRLALQRWRRLGSEQTKTAAPAKATVDKEEPVAAAPSRRA
jgi:hypothetical protein